jgi:hypothetical protein
VIRECGIVIGRGGGEDGETKWYVVFHTGFEPAGMNKMIDEII